MDINNPSYGMEEDAPNDAGGDKEKMISIVRASGNEQLSVAEKTLLWERIAADITQPPVKIWWQSWWKMAAAITLLLSAGLGWWQWQRTQEPLPALVAFANDQSYTRGDTTVTRMILGNQQLLNIRNSHAAIAYQAKGTQVRIDSQEIKQELEAGRQVFNTLLVPYGNVASLQLEDGTRVWLNAGSRLVYPAGFGQQRREVFLEGEAYFEVATDAHRPFSVYANDMKVAVLGTAFNISAYREDASSQVVLASGSVQLEAFRGPGKKSTPVQLSPGNRALFTGHNGNMTVDNVDVTGFISWKDGLMVAEHTSLYEILKKLSRYYNQPITTDTRSGNETFSGNLDLQKTLNDVLDIIAATTSLKYEKQGNTIIFKTK
ncbi:DUF4974 domain-containing protein [Chitinophaga sp. G-6-1-13]|uniref:DUF4974 domain-containing protein n=1 Tax=Chitinophaga fulva TaxID=2728842 RepID=A0A848GR63_9BACT|nr:FecR domain-containing protein [Chitinophaga fulva]NML40884.1 DUF4974 domain-containing protein [Chitinophaga fulva]